jgi:hypothetical protein
MKVILVARKALAAYLISSDVSHEVNSIGVSLRKSGRYNSRSTAIARSLVVPQTMRSGRRKSSMADPSRKNSGFDATSKSASERIARMGLFDESSGSHRHRRLRDDDRVAVERLGDLFGGLENVGQVRMAVTAPRRRSDGE